MNKIILISIVFFLSLNSGFTQTAEDYNRRISELQNQRTNITTQIKSLQNDLNNIDGQIKALEQRKNALSPQFASVDGIKSYISSGGGTLRQTSNINGRILTTLKEGDVVYVREEERNGLYLKVNYQGTHGFVNYNSLKSNDEINKLMTSKTPVKTTTTIISADTNSDKYKRLSKLYGHEKAVKMCSGQLWKGMSMGQIRESLGVPPSTKKVNTLDGLQETWIYSDKEVVIVNGSLSSWTDK